MLRIRSISRLAALSLLGACASRTPEAFDQRIMQQNSGPAIYPSIGLGVGSFGWGGSGVRVGTGLGVGLGGASASQGCSVVFEVRKGMVQGFNRNGPGCVA